MSNVCQFLPWDTDFFGARIARVNGHHLTTALEHKILTWCQAQKIDCLYFLADIQEPQTAITAQQNGYLPVDLRITLEFRYRSSQRMETVSNNQAVEIHPVLPQDVPALQNIAQKSYELSRFYADSAFSRQRCSDLYTLWITKSCEDFPNQVFVARLDDAPVGYLTVKVNTSTSSTGIIELVGISRNAQGKGVGQSLTDHALGWFAEQDIQRIEVVTQGRNLPAQRLYQRSGFLTKNIQIWYHKWFTNTP